MPGNTLISSYLAGLRRHLPADLADEVAGGKTSVACAAALQLAGRGRRVLLVSTDPASNAGQVLGVTIGSTISPVDRVAGLSALEINPGQAAEAYRERIIAPVRGLLPGKELAMITGQLSGSCT
ncbi:MAG: ArsA-related P-loop ATPase, partial [Streptosporangiaceae bacterium]